MPSFSLFYRTLCLAACLILSLQAQIAHADDFADIWQLVHQAKYEDALEQMNAYLVENPKNADAKLLKAMILGGLEQDDQAISTLTDLSLEMPELPQPYNNIAVLYARQGEYEKARTALEKLMNIQPDYPLARENLADIYSQLAQDIYKEQNQRADRYANMAIKSYETVLSSNPDNAEAKYKLANITQILKVSEQSRQFGATDKMPIRVIAFDKTKEQEAVLNTVKAWLDAWQNERVANYLSYYSPTFKTPNGDPRDIWEKMREERILSYPSINIEMAMPKISFQGELAKVSYKQTFQAGDKSPMIDNKLLILKKYSDKWLIEQERSNPIEPVIQPLPVSPSIISTPQTN